MMRKYNEKRLRELLYRTLETEIGGIDIYVHAIECALNEELRDEWERNLEETRTHRALLLELFAVIDLDPDVDTPARKIVAHGTSALIRAMEMAQEAGDAQAAELVATECVLLAETRDHLNWEVIGHLVKSSKGKATPALAATYQKVAAEEDHHLHHSKGFSRELWIRALGLPAVVPPPEEKSNVESAVAAVRSEHVRDAVH